MLIYFQCLLSLNQPGPGDTPSTTKSGRKMANPSTGLTTNLHLAEAQVSLYSIMLTHRPTPTYIVSSSQETWLTTMRRQCRHLLENTPPVQIAPALRHLLSHDEAHWQQWKRSGCTTFERYLTTSDPASAPSDGPLATPGGKGRGASVSMQVTRDVAQCLSHHAPTKRKRTVRDDPPVPMYQPSSVSFPDLYTVH